MPVKKPARNILASLFTAMYLVISMSPLAPLAMRSKVVAHAVTGECSGDCDICGCSMERRANHTCCCYLKKQKELHGHDECDAQVPECCKTKQTRKKETALTRNCPCGSGKHLAFFGAAKIELLPHPFVEHICPLQENPQHHTIPQRLTSRHAEPPDPPPRHSITS
jgi:hypothetical protein